MSASLFLIPAGILLLILVIVLVNWLWNSTLPRVFGFKEITIWETFKILILAAILFGGLQLPFGYVHSTTQGGVTTTWTLGSPGK